MIILDYLSFISFSILPFSLSFSASTLAQYGGVLGNIATELETDLLKPNGEKPLKTSSFISSWEISSKCSSKTIPSATPAKDDICASYFDSSISGLANCYGFVSSAILLTIIALLICVLVMSCELFRRRFRGSYSVNSGGALEAVVPESYEL